MNCRFFDAVSYGCCRVHMPCRLSTPQGSETEEMISNARRLRCNTRHKRRKEIRRLAVEYVVEKFEGGQWKGELDRFVSVFRRLFGDFLAHLRSTSSGTSDLSALAMVTRLDISGYFARTLAVTTST